MLSVEGIQILLDMYLWVCSSTVVINEPSGISVFTLEQAFHMQNGTGSYNQLARIRLRYRPVFVAKKNGGGFLS